MLFKPQSVQLIPAYTFPGGWRKAAMKHTIESIREGEEHIIIFRSYASEFRRRLTVLIECRPTIRISMELLRLTEMVAAACLFGWVQALLHADFDEMDHPGLKGCSWED